MTLRGLAAGVAGWFGREPVLEFVEWAEFERRVGAGHAEATREHVARSIAASIDRAREVLGYRPRFSSLDALHESLAGSRTMATSTSAASSPRRARPRGRPAPP